VGTSFFADTNVPDGGAVSVAELGAAGTGLAIGRIEPNPSSASARISFTMPERGRAKLSVYDITGRQVRVLLDDEAPAGTRAVAWDGRDATGRSVASGVYLVRLEADGQARTAKIARIR
jgi:flagellar hook assembly protein FlgD